MGLLWIRASFEGSPPCAEDIRAHLAERCRAEVTLRDSDEDNIQVLSFESAPYQLEVTLDVEGRLINIQGNAGYEPTLMIAVCKALEELGGTLEGDPVSPDFSYPEGEQEIRRLCRRHSWKMCALTWAAIPFCVICTLIYILKCLLIAPFVIVFCFCRACVKEFRRSR